MIDVDSLIKALRLAWLKRIFSNNSATWTTYFMFLLKELGGPLIFSCNYDIDDLSITSLFIKSFYSGGHNSAMILQTRKTVLL